MKTKILFGLGLVAVLSGCAERQDNKAREYAEELPNLRNCDDGDSAVLTIADIGWDVYVKKAGVTYGNGQFTDTQGQTAWDGTDTVYLPRTWYRLPVGRRAYVGCHELTHVLQHSRKSARLNRREPAWAIAFELEAEVAGYIASVRNGENPNRTESRAYKHVDKWPTHTTAGEFDGWDEWSELSKEILSERIWDAYDDVRSASEAPQE